MEESEPTLPTSLEAMWYVLNVDLHMHNTHTHTHTHTHTSLKIVYHRRSPEEAYRIVMGPTMPSFLAFRDASYGKCMYNLTLQHCFNAVHKV